MITLNMRTRQAIVIERECVNEVAYTRVEIDLEGEVWIICGCCRGAGEHPYHQDSYLCVTCEGMGEFPAKHPELGWLSYN
jgi:hypothetical protein